MKSILNWWGQIKPFFINVGLLLKKSFNFICPIIENIFLAIFSFCKKLFNALGVAEKVILLVLFLVLVFFSFRLANQENIKNTILVPEFGGMYTEGMVAEKASDISGVIDKLTKVGLTRFDNDANLQGDLATSWDINDDGKTYIFHLRDIADANNLVTVLKNKKDIWQSVDISASDKSTLVLRLSQPYSPMLNLVTEPMFDYGPYKLESQTKTELRFIANKNFYLGSPYVETIVEKLYATQEDLDKGFAQQEVDGLADAEGQTAHKGYTIYSMNLPKWQVVFFNTKNSNLADKTVRQKIARGEKLDKNIDLTLVTTDKSTNISQALELKNKWQALGVNLNIVTRDAATLQKTVIPNRDYDVLLYGIDYGRDPDSYPFWHSSQIGASGLNLSNFENVDVDKILEQARQTMDQNQRKDLYNNLQNILNDEVPAIFLNQTVYTYEVSNKVKGVTNHSGITAADRFNEVWKWWILEKRIKK